MKLITPESIQSTKKGSTYMVVWASHGFKLFLRICSHYVCSLNIRVSSHQQRLDWLILASADEKMKSSFSRKFPTFLSIFYFSRKIPSLGRTSLLKLYFWLSEEMPKYYTKRKRCERNKIFKFSFNILIIL